MDKSQHLKPTFTLHSPETKTDYVIYIHAPDTTEQAGPWPVVVFLDGDDQFQSAIVAYKARREINAVPPLLLVGVGYGASYAKPANRRGRDYTPTAHSDEPTSGHAAEFVDFLQFTLWPELARRFPIDDKVRGIAGHSLGSLLALYALLREPIFFTHALASAPSIWWDNRSILQLIKARHDRNATLPATLFLSVGERDTESMTSDLNQLEQQLRDSPFAGLQVISRRFPGKNHFNVLTDAFGAGLESLFG